MVRPCKLGDRVIVFGHESGDHTKYDDSPGFTNVWVRAMDAYIGGIYVVRHVDDGCGVVLDLDTGDTTQKPQYLFPPTALGFVDTHYDKETHKIIVADPKL